MKNPLIAVRLIVPVHLKTASVALLALVSVWVIVGCGDKSSGPEVDPVISFPMRLGTRWHYRIELLSINDSTYQDSTIAYLIRAIRKDTLVNDISMVIMDDTLLTFEIGGTDTSVQRYWIAMAQSKLLRYATDYDAMDDFPPSFDPAPRVVLDFPLTLGKVWANRFNGIPRDSCQVVGYEYLRFLGEDKLCGIVQTRESFYSPFPEERLEWYSDIGLMKAETSESHIRKRWILVDYYPFNY